MFSEGITLLRNINMLKYLVLTTLFLGTTGYVVPPSAELSLNGEDYMMLFDINSADVYVFGPGLNGVEENYDPSTSPTYKKLSTTFEESHAAPVYYSNHTFRGNFAEDELTHPISGEQVNITFGLVDKFDGVPYESSFDVLPLHGVVGFNPWMESKTNTGEILFGKKGMVLGYILGHIK